MVRPYKPIEGDTLWITSVIGVVREGGFICFPATFLIYKVSHTLKQFELQNPSVLAVDECSYEVHLRTTAVLDTIGWTMKPELGA
jgi:hypothetical protein